MNYEWIVITKVPKDETGNWAMDGESRPAIQVRQGSFILQKPHLSEQAAAESLLGRMKSVFFVGELILVDLNGRELSYPQRKPSKWDVEMKTFPFEKVDEAIACAREAFEKVTV